MLGSGFLSTLAWNLAMRVHEWLWTNWLCLVATAVMCGPEIFAQTPQPRTFAAQAFVPGDLDGKAEAESEREQDEVGLWTVEPAAAVWTAAGTRGDFPRPLVNVPAPAKSPPPAFPGPKTLPPTGPWKPLYYLNDFSYKQQPDHQHLFGESLKLMPVPLGQETLTLSTGGELRHRYMNEDNRLRPGGPVHTDYHLFRWRHYIDASYGDFRVYFEGLHADSYGSSAPDQAIDVNHWDILNLFVDVTLLDGDYGRHTFRYGRQELQFSRQRLISALDWANTRRNFEGGRYMIRGDDFTLDGFLVHPVNSATGYNSLADYGTSLDQPNYGVWFGGVYYSYLGLKNTIVDSYWLLLDTAEDVPNRPDGQRHLLGGRVSHLVPVTDGRGNSLRVWDLDAEGGWQFGRDNGEAVTAGFFTTIVGHTWSQALWSPRFAGQFYYGSGDRLADSGHNNTFNTLFPLGHAYWGISDNLSGQNLYDWALQADVKPTSKSAVTAAYHWLALASDGDVLYNVAGLPIGTPGNGRDVGQTLDLYGYYAFSPNLDVQLGYSWFWYGSYVQTVAPRSDATQFYIQTSFRY